MMEYILLAAAMYTLVVTGIYLIQRKLIYFPNVSMESPAAYGLADSVRVVTLETADKVTLRLWFHPAREGFPTIVYFHGNAGNLGDRAHKFKGFIDAGFGLIAVSYRGYGGSGGAPTEAGVYEDARAAMRFALQMEHLPLSEVMIYGESLGTGVATQMAVEHEVGALALEAPYTSVEDRSAELYPYLPARRILKDKFNSLSRIGRIRSPLLILHGELDKTIPIAHGRRMLAAAPEPKRGVFYPHVGHTDFDLPEIIAELLRFAKEHGMAS